MLTVFLLSGVFGGIYRSAEHAKSMSQFSLDIIRFDALFIYGYKNDNINVSIPKKRYLKKIRHLEELKIYNFRWEDNLNIDPEKLTDSNYDPLSF